MNMCGPRDLLRRWVPLSLARVSARWQGRIAWHVLGAAGAAGVALYLFARVGDDVFDHDSESFDGAVQRWMLAHQARTTVRILTCITNAGGTLPHLVIVGSICVWLWLARGRHAASGAIAAPVVAVALFHGIKLIFARARPGGALHFNIHTYSFPSGHSTVSMSAAVTIAYVLWRERFLGGATAIALGVLVPLLVGFSRMYLDVHWATDVLGGWCVGLFVAGIAGVLYERMRRDPEVRVAERAGSVVSG